MSSIQEQELLERYLDLISNGDREQIKPQLTTETVSLEQDFEFQRLVTADLDCLVNSLDLDLTQPMWRILLVQSVLGHAQMGHGLFGDKTNRERIQYPHATIPDIIRAARMDVGKTKEQRERPIKMFESWISQVINEKTSQFSLNGEPLMGVRFLDQHKYQINNLEQALKGPAIMGFVDSNRAREAALKHYGYRTTDGRPLKIGGGETYVVDPRALSHFKLNFELLASREHNEEAITCLRHLGVIVKGKQKNGESAYLRRRVGAGTSDDLAFILIGVKYGVEAMIGAFLVDAIDTYDKCIAYPAEKGRDELISNYVCQQWKKKTRQELITEQDVLEIINFSAKKNVPSVSVSSSHRKLVQFVGQGSLYQPAILSHLAFVEGKPTSDFRVGFNGGPTSKAFYDKARVRISNMCGKRDNFNPSWHQDIYRQKK